MEGVELDLSTLADRTGLERRRLRYVLDHELVPRLKIDVVDDESGRQRHFAEDVGFGIACAVSLLDTGLPHETIRQFLSALLTVKIKPDDAQRALASVLQSPKSPLIAHADFGGDGWVRLRVESYDSDWLKSGRPRKPPVNFEPLVIVQLNIGRIRDLVFSRG